MTLDIQYTNVHVKQLKQVRSMSYRLKDKQARQKPVLMITIWHYDPLLRGLICLPFQQFMLDFFPGPFLADLFLYSYEAECV